jgi:FRG domain-containing protein
VDRITVVLISKTKKISKAELRRVAAALDRQVKEHLGPAWNISAEVRPCFRPSDRPRNSWPVTVRDRLKEKGAVSYHDIRRGRPFAEVSYELTTKSGIAWSNSASHDLLEMLVDPRVDRTVRAPSIVRGQKRNVVFPVQICDPCADARYAYRIGGVQVADFTTQDYWNPTAKRKGKYSFRGSLTKPFQILPGGYLSWLDPKTGWKTTFGDELDKDQKASTPKPAKSDIVHSSTEGGIRFQNPVSQHSYKGLLAQREKTREVVSKLIRKFGGSQKKQAWNWAELTATSIEDLYTILNRLSDTQSYVFRGQASVKWKALQPSLHRSLEQTKDKDPVMTEGKSIQAFRRWARSLIHPSELVYFERILDSITLMQHYGAPTRLLDWTFSPWVSCYFATLGEEKDDAVIWAFNQRELSAFNHEQFESDNYESFGSLETVRSVVEWINAARNSGPYVKVFRYEYANPQMSAQQSLFTITGRLSENHDAALGRSLHEPWQKIKIIIPKRHKETLRGRLFTMNVSPLALFPTPEGVGRTIREAVESRLSLGDESLVWSLEEMTSRVKTPSN